MFYIFANAYFLKWSKWKIMCFHGMWFFGLYSHTIEKVYTNGTLITSSYTYVIIIHMNLKLYIHHHCHHHVFIIFFYFSLKVHIPCHYKKWLANGVSTKITLSLSFPPSQSSSILHSFLLLPCSLMPACCYWMNWMNSGTQWFISHIHYLELQWKVCLLNTEVNIFKNSYIIRKMDTVLT